MTRRRGPILKRWSEASAVRLTNMRMYRIRQLYREIAELWNEQDDYIVRSTAALSREVEQHRSAFVARRRPRDAEPHEDRARAE